MRCVSVVAVLFSLPQVKFHQQKAVAQYSTTILIEALHFLHTASQKNYYATSASGVFHLALEDSITSFWPPESRELSAFTIHRLSCVEDLRQLEGEGPVGVVVDVTCPRWLGEEEVRCQTRLLDVVLNVCSVSTVVGQEQDHLFSNKNPWGYQRQIS